MQENKGVAEQTIVVILAAGKGARMERNDRTKVCLEIDTVPAVNRMITTFKKHRFSKFLLVLGTKTGQILDVVGKAHPEVMYVYQQPQLGTGHAAKIAADALKTIGYNGNVLVTMGDKLIEEAAIEALVGGYIRQQADLALLTIPKTKATEGSGGRAFLDGTGRALDIIEKTDLARQAIADQLKETTAKSKNLTASAVMKIVNKHIANPQKQAVAVSELLALAQTGKAIDKSKLDKILKLEKYNLKIAGKKYSARQIEKICKTVNPSLYLFKAEAFYRGVGMIDNKNAQAEYYLTDVVKLLGGVKDTQRKDKFRIRAVPIKNPDWIQGFNSPDELLTIQDYVRRKKTQQRKKIVPVTRPALKHNQYCTVSQWISKIEGEKPTLKRWLKSIYGRHTQLQKQKLKDLADALQCYGKRFGFDQKVCIVRAPGRLNLMGRHIDHQGGFNNFLAIDRETIAVAGFRDDNNVIAINTEPRKFKSVQFNIPELIGGFTWSDWINFVNSDRVRNMIYTTAGQWGNYIKAAMLRLQHKYQDVKVNGMNLAISGNVPIAAGLSSSSTLMVATLQAAIALNNFELTSRQLIDLCGEGEWFVGSRSAVADLAAVYLGQRSKIAHVGNLPFRVEKLVDAPQDYQILIANSYAEATSSASAKDTSNQKLAAYNLGLALLKQCSARLADTVEYLRDIDPKKLGCSISDIYRFLLNVPQFMSREDFKSVLSKKHRQLIEESFSTHPEPRHYNVRGVLLFGIAEIARSKICMDYLQAGQIQGFGELMNISHAGDRVSRAGGDGRYRLIEQDCSDVYLNGLIADLSSEDPQRVWNAQLYTQPGRYGCSTPQIDQMVDIVNSVRGVAGSQIAGAGLGGWMMILVKKDRIDAVRRALNRNYYRPRGLKLAVIQCVTVEGAGLAKF